MVQVFGSSQTTTNYHQITQLDYSYEYKLYFYVPMYSSTDSSDVPKRLDLGPWQLLDYQLGDCV